MAETTQQDYPETENNPFVSFLHKLNLKFQSFNKNDNNSDHKREEIQVVTVEDKRNSVKLVEKPKPAVPPEPLKIENDEENNTSPAVLWQVYALGGFLILRWIWGRWNERKARKGSSDDPGSDDDQDYDAED